MAVSDYSSQIASAAATYGLDPSLLSAVISAESAGNPNAISPVGAQGLMQLMPATGASLGVTNPFDPTQNINAGAQYLSQLISQFGDVSTALAAYNFGPGNVSSGKSWPTETVNYVNKILGSIGLSPTSGSSSTGSPTLDLGLSDDSEISSGSSSLVPILLVAGIGLLAWKIL